VIDDIADKRLVHRVLEHRLGDTDAFLAQYQRPSTPASPLSSRRETRPGVFDDQFTLKFIEIGRDPVGIPPPNIVLKSQVQIGERKTRANGGFQRFLSRAMSLYALRTFE
jgi:hypothetical protein